MNHTYRVVYNETTNTYTAVSELATARGKSSKSKKALALAVTAAALQLTALNAEAAVSIGSTSGNTITSTGVNTAVSLTGSNGSSSPISLGSNIDATVTGTEDITSKAIAIGDNVNVALAPKKAGTATPSGNVSSEAIAIGHNTSITGGLENSKHYSIAIGSNASVQLVNEVKSAGIAIGHGAVARDHGTGTGESSAIAIGLNARANGSTTHADRKNPIHNLTAPAGENSLFLDGKQLNAEAIAIGHNASTQSASVVIGDYAFSRGLGVSIGSAARAPGVSAVVIGAAAYADGNTGLAIGRQAVAKGDFAQGIGNVVVANGVGSFAVGHSANATGYRAIAIGSTDINNASNSTSTSFRDIYQQKGQTNANGQDTMAMMSNATATGCQTISIGLNSRANGTNDIAFGTGASAGNASALENATAIGTNANASAENSTAFGTTANATGVGSIAFGTNATTAQYASRKGGNATSAIAIGAEANTEMSQDIAIGGGSSAKPKLQTSSTNVVSRDNYANASGQIGSVVLGYNATSAGLHGDVLIGAYANNNLNEAFDIAQSTAVGSRAYVYGDQATALGADTNAIGNSSISIGGDDIDKAASVLASSISELKLNNGVLSVDTVSDKINEKVGSNEDAKKRLSSGNVNARYMRTSSVGDASIAVGATTQSLGAGSVAMGVNAITYGNASVATGVKTRARGENSLAFGSVANATGNDTIAMGHNATVGNATLLQAYNQAENDYNAAVGQGNAADIDKKKTALDAAKTALANMVNATAIGTNANASAQNAYSFGLNSKASAENSIAFGTKANASSVGSIAFGANASAGKTIISGTSNYNNYHSIAIGTNAAADAQESVVLGHNAKALGLLKTSSDIVTGINPATVVIGTNAASRSNRGDTIVGGMASNNYNQSFRISQSTIVGSRSRVFGDQATALGSDTSAIGNSSFAIGGDDFDSARSAIETALGKYKTESGYEGGNYTSLDKTITDKVKAITGNDATAVIHALGAASKNSDTTARRQYVRTAAIGDASIAFGTMAQSGGVSSIAEGTGAIARSDLSVALGSFTDTYGKRSIAIGTLAKTGTLTKTSDKEAIDAISIGTNSTVIGNSSIAIGTSNLVTGDFSGAFGDPSTVSGTHSYSFGNNNTVSGNYTYVFGENVSVKTNNSVILGNGSQATTATNETKATVGNITYGTFAGNSNIASNTGDYVSVGAVGRERQIKHVAPGNISATSTDAINGSQLYLTQSALNNVATSVATVFGPNFKVDDNGTVAGNFTVNGNSSITNVQNALNAAVTEVKAGNNVTVSSETGGNGQMIYTINAAGSSSAAGGDTHYYSVNTTNKAAGSNYKNDGAKGNNAMAAGVSTVANGSAATAVGYSANATGAYTLALGSNSNASKSNAIALGNQSKASAEQAVAVGANSQASGTQSVVLGPSSNATAQNSVAIGNASNSVASNAIAIGSGANASIENSIALGAGALTTPGVDTSEATVGNITYGGFKGEDASAVLSVGNESKQRQIQNVAAGQITASSTDAINGSQLYMVTGVIDNLANSTAKGFGPNSTVNSNGSITPSIWYGGVNYTNVEDALKNVSSTWNITNNNNTTATEVNKTNNTVSLDNSSTITVKQNGLNFEFNANTTTLTNTNGKVNTPTNGDNLVNATTVVNAINDSGFTLNTTNATGGELAQGDSHLVKPGSTVVVDAGKNIAISQTGGKISIATKDDVSFNNVTASNLTVGPVTINADGINAGKKPITNVANGTNPTDAVNLSQLNGSKSIVEAGKNTVVSSTTNTNGSITYTVNANGTNVTTADGDNSIKVTTSTNADGTTNYAISANTTDLTNTNGKVNTPTNGDNLVNATTVAKAINESGWNIQANATLGTVTGSTNHLVNPGKTVELVAGRNMVIGQENGNFTFSVNANPTFNSSTIGGQAKEGDTNVTMAANGTYVYENGTVVANQSNVTLINPITIATDSNGNNTISNLTGLLPNTTSVKYTNNAATGTGTTITTSQTAPSLTTTQLNHAATVGDVLNAGWNLQANGQAVDFVKPYDTVNFVNGTGTEVSAKTDGNVSNISFNVKVDNSTVTVDENGNLTVNASAVAPNTSLVNYANGSVVTPSTTPIPTDGKGNVLNVTNNDDGSKTYAYANGTTVEADKVKNVTSNPNHLVNATTVADAINKSGWNATSGKEGSGNVVNTTEELINPGETVKFIAGDNLNLTQAGNNFTYSLNNNLTLTNGSITITNSTGGSNVSLSQNGLNNGNNTITNVANGTNATDAVNLSQLNATKVQVQQGTGTTVTSSTLANGTTVYTVNANGTNISNVGGDHTINIVGNGTNGYTIAANTTNLTQNSNGTISAPVTNSGNLVNASTVADAINNAGFTITTANSTGGVVHNSTTQLVKPGNTVTMDAGQNIAITQNGSTVSIATTDNVTFNNVNASNINVGPVTINSKTGINAGNMRITNVAPGVNGTDAVNVNQLKEYGINLENTSKVLTTYDSNGNVNQVNPDLRTAIINTNEQGTKYFHTNDGSLPTVVSGRAINTWDSSANGMNSTAIGQKSEAGARLFYANGTAVSLKQKVLSPRVNATTGAYEVDANGVVIRDAKEEDRHVSSGSDAIAQGNFSKAITNGSIAIGSHAQAGIVTQEVDLFDTSGNPILDSDGKQRKGAVAVSGENAVAIGNKAQATANETITMGYNSTVSGEKSIAVGENATVSGKQSISIGVGNNVTGNNSGAFGDPSYIAGTGTYAIGNNNTISTDGTFVIGNTITNTTANSVFLGTNAASFNESNQTGANGTHVADGTAESAYTYHAQNDAQVKGVGNNSAPVGVVSVGNANETRQIQGVAAGVISANSTDAINGSQLYYTNEAIGNVQNQVNHLGNRINQVAEDADAGTASAMATATLPQAYIPGKSMVAVGASTYRGKQGYAVGFSAITDGGNWIIKGTASGNSKGHFGATVGAGYQW